MMSRNWLSIAAVIVGSGLVGAGTAWAGPPYVTDDPEPAELGKFEINSELIGTFYDHTQQFGLPSFDINYGLLPDTQAHIGVTGGLVQASDQPSVYGYGDTELGLKYRFVHEDDKGWQPQIAIYPTIEIPTGDPKTGLGSGYYRVFLPVWVQKTIDEWTIFGGGGYWFNRHADNTDYGVGGIAIVRKIDDHWSVGPEIFHQTANTDHGAASLATNDDNGRASTGADMGAVYQIDDDNAVLLSAGRGIENSAASNRFSFFVAYQAIF